jgi:glyoxylase-like metal-dependent hydrolase (beta-lactamase superfamily II)
MSHPGEPALETVGVAQRSAWLERRLPPAEQLAADLWSIPVPIPNNPLRYVNVYVLASDRGLTLIDAGWDSAESWAALCGGLADFGASMSDVRGCLVTHQHFDHIGLAKRVQEASGAWVGLHQADRDAILEPSFRDPVLAQAAEVRWLMWLGASRDEANRLAAGRSVRDPRSVYVIPDRLVEDGEDVRLPGWVLRAVHTPGHTPGHLCFVDENRRLLFSGDHVLPRISPNISAYRHPDGDALADFLGSLRKVGGFGVGDVLPAHEWRFRGLPLRVEQLVAHHQARLAELLEAVVRRPGSVPWELAGELTWSRPWDQYDGYMRISAVGETMAHLVHLLNGGHITATCDPAPRYRAVDRTGMSAAPSTRPR